MKGNVFEFLKERGLIYTTTNEEEVRKLLNGKPIVFYVGYDPTAESLHIGHFCWVVISRILQKAGHKPIILAGGATSMIGDPSGKDSMRKLLTKEDVANNIKSIEKNLMKYLNFEGVNGVKIVNNADWTLNVTYLDFLRNIGTYFNVAEMLTNDSCKMRLQKGGLSFLEMGYMPIQAADVEHLYFNEECRLQIGGSDQWGNITAGCDLMRKKHGITFPAFVTPLLLTTDGKKMGKSEKGALWLDETKTSPYEMYQYFYNRDDKDVPTLLKWFTEIPVKEIEEMCKKDIIQAKKFAAFEITKLVHGDTKASEAQFTSEKLFAQGGVSDNMPEVKIDLKGKVGVLDLLVASGIVASKGEARRLIEQKGISIDNEVVENPNLEITLKKEHILRKGKKVFLKVVL